MNRPTLLLALLLSGLAALAFGQQDGAAVETPVIEIPGALRVSPDTPHSLRYFVLHSLEARR